METPIFNINDLILILSFVVCIVLALFQPLVPYKNKLAKFLLVGLFLSIAVDAICLLLLWSEHIEMGMLLAYTLPYFLVTASIGKGATLYLYVYSVTQKNANLSRVHFLHLIPIAITMTLLVIFGVDSQALLFDVDLTPTAEFFIHSVWYLIKIIPVGYCVASLVSVSRYRTQLRDEYSTISDSAVNGLYWLSLGFLLSWSWTVVVNLLGNTTNYENIGTFGIIDNYVTFLVVIALFAYNISLVNTLLKANAKDSIVETQQSPVDDVMTKVRNGIELQKLYLNQSLNLEDFSNEVGAPSREVSHVINKHFETNFFEFINGYRVEEAKRMLADRAYDQLSILDILHESGFNSKSAFQRFFKRIVGVSPREFRKASMLEQST